MLVGDDEGTTSFCTNNHGYQTSNQSLMENKKRFLQKMGNSDILLKNA